MDTELDEGILCLLFSVSAHFSNAILQRTPIVHLFSPAAPALHAALVKACGVETLPIGA